MWAEFVRVMDTPIGRIALCSNGTQLCALELCTRESRRDDVPVLLRAERELQEYFAGRRREFSVPLCIHGTEFQKKTWRLVAEIPYGETASYKDIAAKLGMEKSCRAVGAANNRNPLPIFIPCHRVIGSDGRLTGYAGGLAAKQFLLELEGRNVEI